MKSFLAVFIIAFTLMSCRSQKKIATPQKANLKTPNIITETRVKVPTVSKEESVNTDKTLANTIDETLKDDPPAIEAKAQETVPFPEEEIVSQFDHAELDKLLQTYVTYSGKVNYKGFKSQWKVLRDYIASLGANMPQANWTKEEKLAYWMNAYNAMTIDLILRNYPLKSIKDIVDPWDQRLWKLGDKWYNLNEIEHSILRKMNEPRIHFGINCASFSCPPLLNQAFTQGQVNTQLEQVARKFINDPLRNTINMNRIEVSKIFSWFAKDFKAQGTLIDFLNIYSDTKIAINAKVRYRDYNWALNN